MTTSATVTIKTDPAGLELLVETIQFRLDARSADYRNGLVPLAEKTKHADKTRRLDALRAELTGTPRR